MGIALWILIGASLALVARSLMAGPNLAGVIGTLALGIGSAVVGGLLGSGFDKSYMSVDASSVLGAIAASMGALFSYRAYALSWSG